jgi:hypothetical protein
VPFYSLTLLMLATAAASTYGVSEWSSNSLASPDPHQTMGPCRCSDLKDLFNRKAEVEKAIATLILEAEIVRATHAGDKKPWAYDDARDRHLFADDLQKAIDGIHDPAITGRVKNMTYPLDCESSVQGDTTCLHKAAKAGEAVYMQYCQGRQTLGGEIVGIASGKNWQEQTSLAKLLDVARDAYDAELKFINDEMERLKPLCKTKGWTGKVLVSYLDKDHGTIPGRGATPIPTTFEEEDRRYVTITVFDDKAYAELSSGYTHKSVTKGGPFDAKCGKYKTVPITVDVTDTIERHGDLYSRPMYFSISIDRSGSIRIQGQVSGVTVWALRLMQIMEAAIATPKPNLG